MALPPRSTAPALLGMICLFNLDVWPGRPGLRSRACSGACVGKLYDNGLVRQAGSKHDSPILGARIRGPAWQRNMTARLAALFPVNTCVLQQVCRRGSWVLGGEGGVASGRSWHGTSRRPPRGGLILVSTAAPGHTPWAHRRRRFL